MGKRKVLLGLGFAAVIAGIAVTAGVGFAQAEDPPLCPQVDEAFMAQHSMRWMAYGVDGWMEGEPGEIMHEAMVTAFAEALDLDPAELETMLESGEHLMDIALAQGLTAEEVWEIMQDVRAEVLESGIEIPRFRERMLDGPFECDEDCEMDGSFPRWGGRGRSFTEGRFSSK